MNTSLNQFSDANKFDNKKIKTVNLKPENSKKQKKIKTFLELWKLGAVYFCTVKTFFKFFKIRGRW